ncbi:MAG: hypothetical protein JW908_00590 [Anaerolineales bacterium]|nr:hypothetical protein [Anaerolineales bacterium]
MKDQFKTAGYFLLMILLSALLAFWLVEYSPFLDHGKLAGGTTNLGALALDETLSVTGATSLGSTLAVTGNTSVGGTLGATGATTLGSTLSVTGAATLGSTVSAADAVTFSGETIYATAEFTPTAGQTLTPAATFYVIGSSGAVSMTLGTTGATAGQMLMLYGDDANTVTINDTNLKSTSGAALSLGQYDIAVFIFNGTDWVEWLLAADS